MSEVQMVAGRQPKGTYENKIISTVSPMLEVARGNIEGQSFIHKFGLAPDFDTTDGAVVIWDGADDGGINAMDYTYSTTADIDTISSSDDTDTQDIEISGLDENCNNVVQTITLTGQTKASLTTPLMRVFRLINRGSTDLAGTCYCYVNGDITAGVPDVSNTVRALIDNGNNQTLMSLYTIPAGKTGYLRTWHASTAGASKSSNYIIDMFSRPTGEVFQLNQRSALSDAGSSYVDHKYDEPEVFTEKTDIEFRVQATAVGASSCTVSAGFHILLIDN